MFVSEFQRLCPRCGRNLRAKTWWTPGGMRAELVCDRLRCRIVDGLRSAWRSLFR